MKSRFFFCQINNNIYYYVELIKEKPSIYLKSWKIQKINNDLFIVHY